jgi:hypothetical protein
MAGIRVHKMATIKCSYGALDLIFHIVLLVVFVAILVSNAYFAAKMNIVLQSHPNAEQPGTQASYGRHLFVFLLA